MRPGPIVHGVLLVGALVFAYQTWTRDTTVEVKRGEVTVWRAEPAQVKAIRFEAENKTVALERRGEGEESWFWGTYTRTIPAPKPPPKPEAKDAGPEEAMSTAEPPPPEDKVETREFPVGEEGDKLLAGVAPLTALRDLGTLTDEQKKNYGLAEPKSKLIVALADSERTLLLGDSVYGSGDRYALDAATGKGYVLPGEILRPLEAGDATLREKKLHAFDPNDVALVKVTSPNGERTMARKPGGADGLPVWTAPGKDEADQTFANFMDRVDKLTVFEYVPDLDTSTLQSLVKVEYLSKKDTSLGHLEVWKKPAPAEGGDPEYYLVSERTRVPAKVHKAFADRIEQDLFALFPK